MDGKSKQKYQKNAEEEEVANLIEGRVIMKLTGQAKNKYKINDEPTLKRQSQQDKTAMCSNLNRRINTNLPFSHITV